jgi:hypothetical protein
MQVLTSSLRRLTLIGPNMLRAALHGLEPALAPSRGLQELVVTVAAPTGARNEHCVRGWMAGPSGVRWQIMGEALTPTEGNVIATMLPK